CIVYTACLLVNIVLILSLFSILIILRHPTSTLFPYTTLFRSNLKRGQIHKINPLYIFKFTKTYTVLIAFIAVIALRNSRPTTSRSEEHTSELQSRENLVCRLLLEKKK